MTIIRKKEFENLITKRAAVCISIYIPTHTHSSEIQQNPILLKNMLKKIESQLDELDQTPPEITKYLDPIQKLVENHVFWMHQNKGLAIFLTSDEWVTYRLPFTPPKTAVVSNKFHLKPLVPLIRSDDRFYVLALTLRKVRLFLGSRYQLTEINIPDLPDGIEEALRYDDPERQLQHQTLSRTGGGNPAIYHGHGDDYDPKENALRYFRIVAESVQEILKEEQAPLILAGIDYLLPFYREANTYPFLFNDEVSSNPDELNLEVLHKQAWEMLSPYFKQEQKEARSKYYHLRSNENELTSTDLKQIVPASYYGRIDTLFIPSNLIQWGIFSPDENRVEFQEEATPENDDLFNLAALHTFLNGGKIYSVAQDNMPGDEKIAAILRY
jgi:hypothetical protein